MGLLLTRHMVEPIDNDQRPHPVCLMPPTCLLEQGAELLTTLLQRGIAEAHARQSAALQLAGNIVEEVIGLAPSDTLRIAEGGAIDDGAEEADVAAFEGKQRRAQVQPGLPGPALPANR